MSGIVSIKSLCVFYQLSPHSQTVKNESVQYLSCCFSTHRRGLRKRIGSDLFSFLMHVLISSEAASHLTPTFTPHNFHTLALFPSCFISLLQLSKQTLNKLSKAGGEGVSWAAATARLHPIRTGSVEKGCGLEPVTSVPVPSALTAFCRERQREGG